MVDFDFPSHVGHLIQEKGSECDDVLGWVVREHQRHDRAFSQVEGKPTRLSKTIEEVQKRSECTAIPDEDRDVVCKGADHSNTIAFDKSFDQRVGANEE